MSDVIFFFSLLGVFNGVLLSLNLLVFTKQKSLSKYLLGALVLALSIRIGKSVLLYFDSELPKIYLQIGLSACLFIGPFLYYYLKSVINEIEILPNRWKWSLIGLLISIILIGSIKPYQTEPLFWNTYVVQSIYIFWFISICATSFLLIPQLIEIYKSKNKLSAKYKWLSIIYFGNVIIAGAFFVAFFGNSMAYYITGPLAFTFFLYLLAFGYFNNQWFEIESKQSEEKYINKKINSKEAENLLEQLDQLMKTKKIFTEKELKLSNVADELKITPHRLSQLLNDNLGKGFKLFINEQRVEAACELLGNNNLMSLEGIGYEVGFKSKSNFFTTFKKLKNVTPAQYKEIKASKAL